jgi:hypothetical protein
MSSSASAADHDLAAHVEKSSAEVVLLQLSAV